MNYCMISFSVGALFWWYNNFLIIHLMCMFAKSFCFCFEYLVLLRMFALFFEFNFNRLLKYLKLWIYYKLISIVILLNLTKYESDLRSTRKKISFIIFYYWLRFDIAILSNTHSFLNKLRVEFLIDKK